MDGPRQAWLVRASGWLFRRLLRFFPVDFHREFGAAAAVTFDDAAAERYGRAGWRGLAALWLRAGPDLVVQMLAERRAVRRGQHGTVRARPAQVVGDYRERALTMAWLVQSLRFAFRALRHAPSHSIVVVGTMALGIGAATAIFAVVNGVLLRPLPFAGSERVVQLCEFSPQTTTFCVASPPNVADLGRDAVTLETAGVARHEAFVAEEQGARFGVRGGIATPGFFGALGIVPDRGRLLEDRDLPKGANHVALVSHAFWQARLGGAPDVIGRTIRLDGRDVRVVGVLRRDVYMPPLERGGLQGIDVWLPTSAGIDDADNRSWRGFVALARSKSGVSRHAVESELAARYAKLAASYPADNAGWTLGIEGLRERVTRAVRPTLWLFQAAVGLVLLIACANVANLLLVRGTAREAEFAVRTALGAGRIRIFGQLACEGLLLSLAGAAVGLPLAAAGARALIRFGPRDIPRLGEVAIDGSVAAFALGVACATAVLFGFAAARQHSGRHLAEALRAQRHGTGNARLRSAVVTVELALALALFLAAALTLRAYGRLSVWEPGFDRNGVAISWMLAPTDAFKTPQAAVEALTAVREVVATIPGVASAGLTSAGPLFGGEETGDLRLVDRAGDEGRRVVWFDVDERYFETLGVTATLGRLPAATDTAGSPQIAVINDTLARLAFGDANPIGRRVAVGNHVSDVVGVVRTLVPSRPDRAAPPEIYWPIRQYRRYGAYLVVRLGPNAGHVESAIKARVSEIAPAVQLTPLVDLNSIFMRTLVSPRFNMWLVGIFAAVATVLAAVGVFGVVAYAVGSRTREIGVRIALGATPGRVTVEFVQGTLRLVAFGGTAGVILSIGLARWFSSLLFGVPASDWMAIGVALVGFGAIATLAGYLPARRANRIDPLLALRSD